MKNEKTFKIGAIVPQFCDQAYLRDRDENIQADTLKNAIKIYLEKYGYWLHEDEKKYINEVK